MLNTEKDRLTAQCDELALVNQCVFGTAKRAKEARGIYVEVQRLMNEQAINAGFDCSARGKKQVIKLETFLAEALEKLVTAEARVKKLSAGVLEAELQEANSAGKCHALERGQRVFGISCRRHCYVCQSWRVILDDKLSWIPSWSAKRLLL